jgi:hypothetical protein
VDWSYIALEAIEEGSQEGDGGWRKGGASERGNAVVTALKKV